MSKKVETGIVSYSSRDSWRRYMLGKYIRQVHLNFRAVLLYYVCSIIILSLFSEMLIPCYDFARYYAPIVILLLYILDIVLTSIAKYNTISLCYHYPSYSQHSYYVITI